MIKIYVSAVVLFINIFSASFVAAQNSGPNNNAQFHLAVVNNVYSNDLSIIDTFTQTELTRIPLPGSPGAVVMTGDGRFAYVATNPPDNKIYKVDLDTLTVTKTIDVSVSAHIVEFEITPDDRHLLVGDISKATIIVLDTNDDQEIGRIELCPQCGSGGSPLFATPAIDFIPNFNQYALVYVAWTGLVHVVNVTNVQEIGNFPITTSGLSSAGEMTVGTFSSSGGPYPLIFANPGTCLGGICRVYVVDPFYNVSTQIEPPGLQGYLDIEVLPYGIAVGRTVIDPDPANNLITIIGPGYNIATIPISETSRHLTYNPHTNQLYSLCVGSPGNNSCGLGAIDIIDLTLNQRIKILNAPVGMGVPALSQDGKYFYVTGSNVVTVMDTEQLEIIQTIPVGQAPQTVSMQGNNSVKSNY